MQNQIRVPILYDDIVIDADLKIDLLVNDCVVVELKAVEELIPIFEVQLMTYMKILKKPQGLLINFFTHNITKSLKPIVNEYFKELPE